jgi:hypothetical protein
LMSAAASDGCNGAAPSGAAFAVFGMLVSACLKIYFSDPNVFHNVSLCL